MDIFLASPRKFMAMPIRKVLVADLRLPDIDGMEVVKQVKAEKPETEVIVITGYGTTAKAVTAMNSQFHGRHRFGGDGHETGSS